LHRISKTAVSQLLRFCFPFIIRVSNGENIERGNPELYIYYYMKKNVVLALFLCLILCLVGCCNEEPILCSADSSAFSRPSKEQANPSEENPNEKKEEMVEIAKADANGFANDFCLLL